MFSAFFHKLKLAFADKELRNRILFVFGALLVFRLLAVIPIPGVDLIRLETFFANNQFLGLLNIFSGGGLSNLSIVMLGVAPYITASIIMQLLTVLSPKLKAMYQEEGDAGRAKFAQWSRYLTVPLAFVQGFAFLTLLARNGVVVDLSTAAMVTNILIITAGSMLLMWIGELITEFGVGNGVSLIIFAGIVAGIPSSLGQAVYSFTINQAPVYLGFAAAAALITAAVVFITEAERPIPVTYSRGARGGSQGSSVSTYLPLRVNQAGVIPIIFAMSLLLFPQMIASFLATTTAIPAIASAAQSVVTFLSNQAAYGILYFVLVVAFTFFYTAVTFDPNRIAENLQKSGAFVPGVRPGTMTSEYVANILTRITLAGALFLGVIAVLPIIMQAATGITSLTLGGTALLIAVSVILDVVKRVEAQLSIREY